MEAPLPGFSPGTGLTHLGAREYDPSTGRFISVDPLLNLAEQQFLNGYTYGNNNPATLADPAGTDPCGGLKCGHEGDKRSDPAIYCYAEKADGTADTTGVVPSGGGTASTSSTGRTSSGKKSGGGSHWGWLSNTANTVVDYGSAIFSQPDVWWGSAETAGSLFLMGLGGDAVVGGGALCLTGVGCIGGAPIAAGGAALIGTGAVGAGDGIGRINDGLGKAFSEVGGESSGSSSGPRTFTSDDPLVGDVANEIEAKYPGLVDDVNVPVNRPDGSTLTDFDVELKNAVIQVKAGPGKGAGAQVTRTQEGTDKPVIVYGPKLRPSVVKEVNGRGAIGVPSMDDLLAAVKP
ncbi:RHS repeat-associated core domain-containing protein [Streptomyces sp. NPDC020898]|uniref:RHS repeat-associated core domain-containing protein n=1 Tax=Streptomyces sp. NPDC020898 TaxID=3365101 RepID=UPI0037921A53